MALKCFFTKLLCEINVILYSTSKVITPSVEIIREKVWLTQLLLEAAHVRGQETPFLSCAIFNKTFLHVPYFSMEEHERIQKEVIWLFNLVKKIPPLLQFINQCLEAKS